MKKLLSIVLATLMILSVSPLVLPQTVIAESTPERIAYLDAAGGNDDTGELGNESKAFATFEAAYNALCPAGGKIVLISPYVFTASIESGLSAHYGEITITADSKNDDYIQFSYAGCRILFAGPVVIENIRLYAADYAYIQGNYNKLVIGEGVTCENTLGTALSETGSTAGKIAILGGGMESIHLDTHVVVKSGVWRAVVGGGRGTAKIMNGTFRIDFEGGYAPFMFGGNWLPGGSNYARGGQAYIRVTGGKVGNLYAGGQFANQLTYLDSMIQYTGGTIGSIRSLYCAGKVTLVYGGSVQTGDAVTSTYFELAKNEEDTGELQYKGYIKNTTLITADNTSMSVLPMATEPDTIVYLSENGEFAAPGTSDKPVRYLNQAIAMLSETGGTIKLLSDYTVTRDETNTTSEFVEFFHKGKITIDGQGVYSIIGLNNTACPHTAHSQSISHTGALATYILNGDTTFKDLEFRLPRDTGVAANFNRLVLDGVEVTGVDHLKVYGGVYQHYTHCSYARNYKAAYATWSDKDTYVTITGAPSDSKFKVYGFSRFNAAASKDGETNCALTDTEDLLHYPGTANITVETGKIADLFPALVLEENDTLDDQDNRKFESFRRDHTAQAAVVNIGGTAEVNALYTGGDSKGCSLVGDVTYNISDNASVNYFGAIDNCDGTRYYNVNSDYATYLKAYNRYKNSKDDIVLTTDIDAPVLTYVSAGTKDFGDEKIGVRATLSISSDYFVGDIADKYNIVELGVLVKTATNEAAFEYVKGDYYYGVTEFGADPQNHEGKIAKSVAYVKEANAEAESYDAYAWAGEGDVLFTAPVVFDQDGGEDTGFVFCPYVVVVDEAGVQQVFIGNPTDAVSYNGLKAK